MKEKRLKIALKEAEEYAKQLKGKLLPSDLTHVISLIKTAVYEDDNEEFIFDTKNNDEDCYCYDSKLGIIKPIK